MEGWDQSVSSQGSYSQAELLSFMPAQGKRVGQSSWAWGKEGNLTQF